MSEETILLIKTSIIRSINYITTGHPNLTEAQLIKERFPLKKHFSREEKTELLALQELLDTLNKTRLIQFHFKPDVVDPTVELKRT